MFEKRVILTQKGKLRILVDSESLDKFLSAKSESAEKLLKYSKYSGVQLFDFIRSPFDTKHLELQKVVEFRKRYDENSDLTGIEIVKDKSRPRIRFRYRMDDIKITANKVYGKGSLTKSEKERVLLVFIQEILYRLTTTDLLITNNEIIVKHRLWFESHLQGSPVNIMTIGEALQFMDLFAKYKDTYYISSNLTCDRGLWYLYSFNTKVSNFQLPWSSVVYGSLIKNGSDTLQGFSNRFIDLLRAIDEIGFEYYKGVNNDTMDGMVYHLNYFITLVTGLFDNLALLSLLYYNLQVKDVNVTQKKNMHKISLRNKDFRKALKKENQSLHEFIIKNKENFIELFYPLREEIIHRSGLKRAGFKYTGDDVNWEMNIIKLSEDVANKIEVFDEESEYEFITKWGIYKSHSEYFLEPFHFVKAATKKLIEFCNKYFELLAVNQLLEKYPEVKRKIEESNESKTHRDFIKGLEIFKRDHLGF